MRRLPSTRTDISYSSWTAIVWVYSCLGILGFLYVQDAPSLLLRVWYSNWICAMGRWKTTEDMTLLGIPGQLGRGFALATSCRMLSHLLANSLSCGSMGGRLRINPSQVGQYNSHWSRWNSIPNWTQISHACLPAWPRLPAITLGWQGTHCEYLPGIFHDNGCNSARFPGTAQVCMQWYVESLPTGNSRGDPWCTTYSGSISYPSKIFWRTR